jgi:hypothetical protein
MNNDWRLATIIKELSESYDIEELQEFMPYSNKALDMMINQADIDWDNLENPAVEEPDDKQGFNTITLQVKDDVFEMWLTYCDKVEAKTGKRSKAVAFEQAIEKAINE